LGAFHLQCKHCDALHWKSEAVNTSKKAPEFSCCGKGSVVLPPLKPPPQPLMRLFYGLDSESQHFLNNARGYNGAFSMVSTGKTNAL
jgi:hypothetical protein